MLATAAPPPPLRSPPPARTGAPGVDSEPPLSARHHLPPSSDRRELRVEAPPPLLLALRGRREVAAPPPPRIHYPPSPQRRGQGGPGKSDVNEAKSLPGAIHSFHLDVLGAGDLAAKRTGAIPDLSGSVLMCWLSWVAVGTLLPGLGGRDFRLREELGYQPGRGLALEGEQPLHPGLQARLGMI